MRSHQPSSHDLWKLSPNCDQLPTTPSLFPRGSPFCPEDTMFPPRSSLRRLFRTSPSCSIWSPSSSRHPPRIFEFPPQNV
ncbi:hypothetical protein HZ326_12209 [Fusarium oxysporum f. sp. albedinis]|nr:hypothetical protein HZ326_12209 [Fusarium oxysporum f. sp. albedinis]